MAVIAVELGWLIATGNPSHDHNGYPDADQVASDENPWRWLISAGFWSAAFAGVLTVFNVGLWRQTKRLAEGADEQSRKMTEAIEASNEIGRATARVATRTSDVAMHMKAAAEAMQNVAEETRALAIGQATSAEHELRAYFLVDSAIIKFPTPAAPVAHVVFRNFGKTPAYRAKLWIHMWIERHPLRVILPEPPANFHHGYFDNPARRQYRH